MKISVLTLTYRRKALLEETIESFLRQHPNDDAEMLVVNDEPNLKYCILNDRIRILNIKMRFKTISEKIKFGYVSCKYDYIYRLDDDDLLAPNAINDVSEDIEDNPGHDIYRSDGNYYYLDNRFIEVTSNVNNGNVYHKAYLDRIDWPYKSGNEDADITFNHKASIYTSTRKRKTMIYRWGMGTFHISGNGNFDPKFINRSADIFYATVKPRPIKYLDGKVLLEPKFRSEYYEQLPK